MKIGYARVSTDDQETHLQIDALKQAKCGRVYQEKASGAKAERPELMKLLDNARKGDVVIVWKLDRLARSLRQLIDTTVLLNERGVELHSLTENINTTTPSGKLTFHIFAALAEFERDILRQRVNAGLKAARRRGRVGGRPKALNEGDLKKARALLRSGTPKSRSPRSLRSVAIRSGAPWRRRRPNDPADALGPVAEYASLLCHATFADPLRRMGAGCRMGPYRFARQGEAAGLSNGATGPDCSDKKYPG
jgi:DNA invertase Pin-like site-specific DNA recombinase